ncbi:MAG TPA: hypothetical protein DCM05_09075 [Elusimicrobia bacterium]|nr:hypothetical protein [Elusimicrobiota bacterium]
MSWILTHTGKHFDFMNIDPDEIDMQDIAVSLAREPRFGGHTEEFYSVAQHSVLASLIVPPGYEFEALLHDATEAYCRDIPSPLKRLLPDYQDMERKIDLAVRTRFNLPPEMSANVKLADKILLAAELRDLMPDDPDKLEALEGLVPMADSTIDRIIPVDSTRARSMFLCRWMDILNKEIRVVGR